MIWLLLLFLVSCGKGTNVTGFESYVGRFENAAASEGRTVTVSSITIDYDPATHVDVGQCETGNFFSGAHIRVNQGRWAYLTDTQREILLFHELGHCVLDRGHREDRLPNGHPASIMFPTLLSASAYAKNRDYYRQELFGQK